jgi:hypothetical protein
VSTCKFLLALGAHVDGRTRRRQNGRTRQRQTTIAYLISSRDFGVITLLPKAQDVTRIHQYRPICLSNVSFKIFIKVATIRLNLVADHIIKPTQTAFMREHNILEGVVILHETIHELHRKKQNGVILKIDFEKAYDKVKCHYCSRR